MLRAYLPGTGLRPLELKEPLTPGEMESAKVLTWGSHSEAIVMLGDEADRRFFRDVAGMVVHGESSVFVADTPSCRLTVAVTASGSIGYWPFKEPARVLHSGTNMLTLPCGPIWLTTTDACLLDGVSLSKASLIGPYVLTMRPGSSPDIQCVAPESDEPPP